MDNLHTAGLINYFGKVSNLKDVEVSPLLITKGKSKLAIYGMSSVKDERLHRLFRENKVKMYRPEEETDEWFNLLMLHQNRAKHGSPTNYIPEHFIDGFFDLVFWGHEHECRITPEKVVYGDDKTFHITQPGSSVATSLCEGETHQKKVGILDIAPGRLFKLEEIPLRTTRPIIFRNIWIEDPEHKMLQAQLNSVDHKKIHAAIEKFLVKYVQRLIERELPPLLTGHPSQPILPLIRVRVEYVDDAHQLTASRFGNNFLEKVANNNEILLFRRRVVKREATGEGGFSTDAFNAVMPMDLDDMVSMEDLIGQYFTEAGKAGNADDRRKNQMKLVGVKGIGSAVNRLIEKDDKDGVGCIVDRQFQKTVDKLLSVHDIEDEHVDSELEKLKKERERTTGGADAAAKMEEAEAEAALDAPDRKNGAGMVDKSDEPESDENMPPVATNKRGKGRGSNRGQTRGAAAGSSRGRGRGKQMVVQESDDDNDNRSDVDDFPTYPTRTARKPNAAKQIAAPLRSERSQLSSGAVKGRYNSIANFAPTNNAQNRKQTNIVSAFARQSQSQLSNTSIRSSSRTVTGGTTASKKSIFYDSDSD